MMITDFKEFCLSHLGSVFDTNGFSLSRSVSRPKGVGLEFIREEERVLISQEGEDIFLDLIYPISRSSMLRFSVNQYIFFNKSRALLHSKSIEDSIGLLRRELEILLPAIKNPKDDMYDSRYCYEMDIKEFDIFMNSLSFPV